MIRRQVVIPVTPERLWQAVTDPDEMAGWFGARVEWELREGAPARFRDDDGTTRAGRIVAVRPERHLRFRWWPEPPDSAQDSGAGAGRTDPDGDAGSEVSYLLEPLDEGTSTRLTIQERPLPAGHPSTAQASAAGWSAWDTRLAATWARMAMQPAQIARA